MEKRIFSFLLLCLCITDYCHAGGLSIWPVNPHIETGASSSALWMKNSSDRPVTLQARVMIWTQQDYRDIHEPQNQIAISPPIVTIPANSQQMFRIVNRQGATSSDDSQHNYRILIDEIPTETPGASRQPISFQIRYSLPLFIFEKEGHNLPESLHYTLDQHEIPLLTISNTGARPVRISQAEIINQHTHARLMLTDGLLGYVLPGSRMRWTLTQEQADLLAQEGTYLKYRQERKESAIHRYQ